MKDIRLTNVGRESLEELFVRERLGLLRLAFLLSGSLERAEDVVQIAFAEAAERWDHIENPGGYLRQVVVNRIKDGQRRDFRRRRLADLRRSPEPVTNTPEIDETWDLVKTLPWTQQAVVVLRFYEDLPLTEIARMFDRPESTVRSDLRRALQRLRKTVS